MSTTLNMAQPGLQGAASVASQPRPGTAGLAKPPATSSQARQPATAAQARQPAEAAGAQPLASAAAGTPRAATADALSSAALRRRRRADVALRLLEMAPEACESLRWDDLDQAPEWMALPDAAWLCLQARIGALLYARSLRLWIDGPRLSAARALLGAAVLDELLAIPDEALPRGLTGCPTIDAGSHVGPRLKVAGAAVLIAALPPSPLRAALATGLAPAGNSAISPELAESLIARAQALGGAAAWLDDAQAVA